MNKIQSLEETIKCFTTYKNITENILKDLGWSIYRIKKIYSENDYQFHCPLCQYSVENTHGKIFLQEKSCVHCPLLDFWKGCCEESEDDCPCESHGTPYAALAEGDYFLYEEYQKLCQSIIDAAEQEIGREYQKEGNNNV